MSLSELQNEKAREIWAKSSQRDSNKDSSVFGEKESPYFLKDKKDSSSRSFTQITGVGGSGASSLYLNNNSRNLPVDKDGPTQNKEMLKEDSMFSNDLLTKIDSKHPSKQILLSKSEF